MPELEAAKLVLYGTLVGAFGGMAGVVIQAIITNRAEAKRRLLDLAFQSATKELEIQLKFAKPGSKVYPPILFVHQHTELLKLIREGNLTPERYKEIQLKTKELMDSIDA